MSDFPITLNGTLWNRSDFEGTGYYNNLGRFIQDSLVESSISAGALIDNFMAPATGSLALTLIPLLKNIAKGQRIILTPANPSDTTQSLYQQGYMEGYVVDYDDILGEVQLYIRSYMGSSSYRYWHLNFCGLVDVSLGTIPPLVGGTGQSTRDNALVALGFHSEASSPYSAELLEDFVGATLNSPRSGNSSGAFIKTTGAGSVTTDGNVTAANSPKHAARALDGNHPGIAVLEVTGAGALAEVSLGSTFHSMPNGGGRYSFCFLMDFENDSSDVAKIKVGLRDSKNVGDREGWHIWYPNAISGTSMEMVYGPGAGDYNEFYSGALEPGVWYEVVLETIVSASYRTYIYRHDPYGIKTLLNSYPADNGPAVAAGAEFYPFVSIEKTAGQNSARLWVDYIYMRPFTSR